MPLTNEEIARDLTMKVIEGGNAWANSLPHVMNYDAQKVAAFVGSVYSAILQSVNTAARAQ